MAAPLCASPLEADGLRCAPPLGEAREVVSQARVVPSLRARLAPLGIVLLSLAASAPSLSNGFAVDDVPIIASDARIRSLDAPWRFFAQTYWPPTTKSALYRPLTSLAFAVEWRLGHGKPWVYHATNVLLYALVSLSVYRLAVLLLGGLAGWWAAALFAVHPVHVEAVGNSVGQSELWAALLVVLAVRHYIVVRRARDIATRDIARLSALYAVACLFKEHALMLPGLLIAAEMTVLDGGLSDAITRSELRRLGLAPRHHRDRVLERSHAGDRRFHGRSTQHNLRRDELPRPPAHDAERGPGMVPPVLRTDSSQARIPAAGDSTCHLLRPGTAPGRDPAAPCRHSGRAREATRASPHVRHPLERGDPVSGQQPGPRDRGDSRRTHAVSAERRSHLGLGGRDLLARGRSRQVDPRSTIRPHCSPAG